MVYMALYNFSIIFYPTKEISPLIEHLILIKRSQIIELIKFSTFETT
jgi:hypothetical protein